MVWVDKYIHKKDIGKMDIGVLNELGYVEVIEISIWLGVMYYGKCWIDDYFNKK